MDVAAEAPGDGSIRRPFADLAVAVGGAEDGATLRLAPGRYPVVDLRLDGRRLTIASACDGSVVLHGEGSGLIIDGGVVTLLDLALEGFAVGVDAQGTADVTLRRVSFSGGEVGLRVGGESTVTLESSTLQGSSGPALEAVGGRLTVLESVIEGAGGGQWPAVSATDGTLTLTEVTIRGARGPGLRISGPASASLSEVAVLGSAAAGLHAQAEAEVEVTRSVFHGGTPALLVDVARLVFSDSHVSRGEGPRAQHGLRARAGADVRLDGVSFVDLDAYGIGVAGPGARVVGVDVSIEAIGGYAPDGLLGTAVYAVDGGRLELARSHVHGARDVGALARAATVVLSEVRVAEIAAGEGLRVGEGGELIARDSAVVAATTFGALALDDGSDLTLKRATVRATRGEGDYHGFGVSVQVGAAGTLREVLVLDNGGAALGLWHDGSSADIEGSVLRRSRVAPGTLHTGIGVLALGAVSLRLVQSVLSEVHGGVWAHPDGQAAAPQVTIEDSLIHDTLPDPTVGDAGWGLGAWSGAQVTLRRVAFLETIGVGILASGPGTHVDADDVLVRDTQPWRSGEFGAGMDVLSFATADVRRSAFVANRVAGLFVGISSAVTLGASVVHGTEGLPGSEVFAGFGDGVLCAWGCSVALEDVILSRNRRVGLLVAGSSAVVRDSVIHSNLIGVNVQLGTRLGEEVVIDEHSVVRDNRSLNFDAESLGLPSVPVR